MLGQQSGAKQLFVGWGAETMAQVRAISNEQLECSAWAHEVMRLWESTFRARSHAANTFTRREMDVLCELAKGQTTKAIAKTLMLSPETVKYHLKAIFSKLRANTREDALAEARRRALMP